MNLVPCISALARGLSISLSLPVPETSSRLPSAHPLRQPKYTLSVSGSLTTAPPLHLGCGPELLGIAFKPFGTLLLRLFQIYANSSFSVSPPQHLISPPQCPKCLLPLVLAQDGILPLTSIIQKTSALPSVSQQPSRTWRLSWDISEYPLACNTDL